MFQEKDGLFLCLRLAVASPGSSTARTTRRASMARPQTSSTSSEPASIDGLGKFNSRTTVGMVGYEGTDFTEYDPDI